MVQDQLVEYISSQLKLGVSRDTVKTALVGVGWAEQDVEDTLKKVEGSSAAAAVKPATASTSAVSAPAGGVKAQGASASIKVSDLVSASLTPTGISPSSSAIASGPAKAAPKTFLDSSSPSAARIGSVPKRMGKSMFVMIGLILVLAGLSAYLYFENSGLSSQVASATGQSQGNSSEISSLNNQVQALNASNTTLTAQISELNAQIEQLQANLSFLVVPAGESVAQPVDVAVSGMLSGGKPVFVLATPEGVRVTVKNSTDPDVKAALTALVGSSSTVQISGTHIPGSAAVTVSGVNGRPVSQPQPAAASSTPAAAPMIPASGTPSSTGQ
ncbi:MAG: FlxA-like family protein [Patescibacteria group bacterium]|nr:FlxA-like family protein [Patescibacteria group bacterium]